METQHAPKYDVIVSSLRRRARSLRCQVLWLQQSFGDGKRRRLSAEVVHEVIALKEEVRELDQLAARYERRVKQLCI